MHFVKLNLHYHSASFPLCYTISVTWWSHIGFLLGTYYSSFFCSYFIFRDWYHWIWKERNIFWDNIFVGSECIFQSMYFRYLNWYIMLQWYWLSFLFCIFSSSSECIWRQYTSFQSFIHNFSYKRCQCFLVSFLISFFTV